MPPCPTPRKLIAAALGAVLLAVGLGAAYHLVEAHTGTARSPSDLEATEAGAAHKLGLISVSAGKSYATYAFADAAGNMLRLDDFRGKVLLVNFWATWCTPCREEMPALDRLAARLGSDDFAVLAVAVDRGGADAVRAFYEETGIAHLAVYLDPEASALAAVGLSGIPTTLVIGRDGRELGRVLGPRPWDAAPTLAFLSSYLTAETGAGGKTGV